MHALRRRALTARSGAYVGMDPDRTLYFTPVGRRIRETRNRAAIDQESELTCPIHGRVADGELVRLPGGERLCPFCYREAMQGRIE